MTIGRRRFLSLIGALAAMPLVARWSRFSLHGVAALAARDDEEPRLRIHGWELPGDQHAASPSIGLTRAWRASWR